jgi:hypothetical protein
METLAQKHDRERKELAEKEKEQKPDRLVFTTYFPRDNKNFW